MLLIHFLYVNTVRVYSEWNLLLFNPSLWIIQICLQAILEWKYESQTSLDIILGPPAQDKIINSIYDYFSPFVLKNVKVNFFADTSQIEDIKICKADVDQDRPNWGKFKLNYHFVYNIFMNNNILIF